MHINTVNVKQGFNIGELGQKLTDILKEPQQFLCAQSKKYQHLSRLLLQTYQLALISDEHEAQSTFMSELVLEGMQEEQIWQQLELRNKIVVPHLEDGIVHMITVPEEILEIGLNENGCKHQENEMDNYCLGMEDESDSNSRDGCEQYEAEITLKPRKSEASVVDDKFFKLCEMEAFLEAEDAKEMRKKNTKNSVEDDDCIDFFGKLGEDEDEDETLEYKDFFDNDSEGAVSSIHKNESFNEIGTKNLNFGGKEKADKLSNVEECDEIGFNMKTGENNKLEECALNQKHCEFQTHSDSKTVVNDDIAEEEPKSSFEMLQKRLQRRIQEYEDEVLGEKPWQLKGEIKAASRPQNSLLEEILEFESTTRPAPIITEETTRRLEDIIRQNIKNKAWDDVKLKVKPIHSSIEYRNEIVLDQEKSKQSLAKIYEDEFKNELTKLDPNHAAKEQTEPKEHQEIRTLMRDLFIKLDALSNFHFTTKPVTPDARIITNTPAIYMEEVAPVAVSDAKLMAPEEIFKREKYALIGETERTKMDKHRERRKKKQKQRADIKAKEAQELKKQKVGIPVSKKDVNTKITKYRNVKKISTSSDYGSLKSSKAFFSQLQDRAATNKLTFKKPDTQIISAKKLKL